MRKWKRIEAAALAAVMAFPMTPVYHGVEVKAGKVSVMEVKEAEPDENIAIVTYVENGKTKFKIERPDPKNAQNKDYEKTLFVQYLGTKEDGGHIWYPSAAEVKTQICNYVEKRHGENGTEILEKLKYFKDFQIVASTNDARSKDGSYKYENVKEINIPADYSGVAGNFMHDTNASSLKIYVDENGTLNCWSGAFANNLAVQSIEIHAGTVKLPPNAFKGCENLKNITIKAGETEVYSWGKHVSTGLNSLQNVTFDCKTTFNCEDGFISGVESKFNADFKQHVESNQMVFTNCKLGSVNITGENNKIGKNFLSDCGEVDSVNIDNTTYLGTTAFYNTAIGDFSINAKTTFDDETFTDSSVDNMYVNVDADGNNQELSHFKGEKGSGIVKNSKNSKNSKICNLYFNYANSGSRKTGIVTGLNRFPLGKTEETSINCDNIYFCNPDFKYVGLSDYRAFKTKTKVYAYGGAKAYCIGGEITSSADMFNEWLKDANCEFVNFVKVSDTNISLNLGQVSGTTATVETKTDSFDVDFSSKDTIEVSAGYATDKKDQYAAINKIDKTKKLDMITGSEGSTNFNYRILEKTSDSSLSKEKYNYQFGGQWYTPMTEKKKTLTVGKHEFLVEVAGQKYPFTIEVKKVVEPVVTDVASATTTPVVSPAVSETPKTETTANPEKEVTPSVSPSVVSTPAVTVNPEEIKGITKVSVEYYSKTAPEYSRLSMDPEKLTVTLIKDGKEVLLGSNEQVELSPYEIIKGKTSTIEVSYKGIKASNTISIKGVEDKLSYIASVQYTGSTAIGTKVNVEDVHITAKMKSGNVIDSALSPSILKEVKISDLVISGDENWLKVTFRGEERVIDVLDRTTSSATEFETTETENTVPSESVTYKKGVTFTKNNITYKILSYNGFTGNVSVVRCAKKVTKFSLKSKISVGGSTFTVTTIGKNAFKSCKIKGSITIPDTVTKIDSNAFYGCKYIKKLTLGKKVKTIGAKAFYGCSKLSEVNVSKALKITSIGKSAFKGLSSKLRFGISDKTTKKIQKLLKKSVY
ncbi:MAG: leucine-rich repeat protein [Lachnospiraceae bacterium]|nr:leucine-rich repeat protein [Lachnospiraceae bacterium]